MNPSLIKTEYLATGQTAPFTGNWVNTALCKNGFIVIYASGSRVNISLQAKTELTQSPIFLDGGSANAVTFYTTIGLGDGQNPRWPCAALWGHCPTATSGQTTTSGAKRCTPPPIGPCARADPAPKTCGVA